MNKILLAIIMAALPSYAFSVGVNFLHPLAGINSVKTQLILSTKEHEIKINPDLLRAKFDAELTNNKIDAISEESCNNSCSKRPKLVLNLNILKISSSNLYAYNLSFDVVEWIDPVKQNKYINQFKSPTILLYEATIWSNQTLGYCSVDLCQKVLAKTLATVAGDFSLEVSKANKQLHSLLKSDQQLNN